MTSRLAWGHDSIGFEFAWSDAEPVSVSGLTVAGRGIHFDHRLPLVEILTVGAGHIPASERLVHTQIGEDLRYLTHEASTDARGAILRLHLHSSQFGLEVVVELTAPFGCAAIRTSTTVMNVGTTPAVLRSVSTWSSAVGGTSAADAWTLLHGASDWLGEGRWSRSPLRQLFPDLAEELTGHNPRGAHIVSSTGTWSTGNHLPVAALESVDFAWLWQVEHNGSWRWEVGDDIRGPYFAIAGPTDVDSAWTHVLDRGESFTTVPASIAIGTDLTDAAAQLTGHRRSLRRAHPDSSAMPVVFNDYMNTLNGDPTTEKLLPLISAAAEVGAEIFCIDAGWYDDSGHWWDSVGEWRPSTIRFPGGLGEVVDAIRAAGMRPGLWLEPEVVGLRSPIADRLPAEAFLQRHGQRIVEHGRYHLDLRHPAAIAHLDEVVDRLVGEFGIEFFKLDYNIDPGPGTDFAADSVGDGLLEHNRAHLAWLDSVLDRHPALVIENCSSGAMRTDFAILSRVAMQSTSDQQDFTKFPPIAAAAPLSMLPEQAANWAYPQPEMTAEESAFALATGLLGRFYLSGYLNRMTAEQRGLVSEAVAAAKGLRAQVSGGHPHWPLGLPSWDAPWVALGLRTDDVDVVTVWHRGGGSAIRLDLPHHLGRDLTVSTVFPTTLAPWTTGWDAETGTLTVHATDTPVAARTFRLEPVRT